MKPKIEELSYPDFVAFIRQQNQPPALEKTINFWMELGQIEAKSCLLDLACSTGFSSRVLQKMTSCTTYGIDLSEKAIIAAKELSINDNLLIEKLKFIVADAVKLPFSSHFFTHVIAGSNFGFIDAREVALKETHRVLQKGGKLCISNFFYTAVPPTPLLVEVQNCIGYLPDQARNLNYWQNFYSKYFSTIDSVLTEQNVLSGKILEKLVEDEIYGNKQLVLSQEDQSIAFKRLLQTRIVLNEHRKYQKILIAVLEKRNG